MLHIGSFDASHRYDDEKQIKNIIIAKASQKPLLLTLASHSTVVPAWLHCQIGILESRTPNLTSCRYSKVMLSQAGEMHLVVPILCQLPASVIRAGLSGIERDAAIRVSHAWAMLKDALERFKACLAVMDSLATAL